MRFGNTYDKLVVNIIHAAFGVRKEDIVLHYENSLFSSTIATDRVGEVRIDTRDISAVKRIVGVLGPCSMEGFEHYISISFHPKRLFG